MARRKSTDRAGVLATAFTTVLAGWLGMLALVACGDDTESSHGATTGPPEPVGRAWGPSEVCDHIATSLCDARESCCRFLDLAYDEVRCEARERQSCQATMDLVDEGRLAYDGTRIDACLEELARLYGRCMLPAQDSLIEVFDIGLICARAFAGTRETGQSCATDGECVSEGDTLRTCDDTAQVCVASTIRHEGGACDLEGNICAPGLFCDFDLSKMPYEGTCERALPFGADCDPAAVVSPCGPDKHCHDDTSVCSPLFGPGESCDEDRECQSQVCDGGFCTALLPAVDDADCSG